MHSSQEAPSSPAARKPEQPGWIKKAFWYFAPAQSAVIVQATDEEMTAEYYPSMDISGLGHILMALFWIGAVFAYSIFVTYQHFTKPDMESFMHEPSEIHNPVKVLVTAWCTRPDVGCGNITISQDYSRTGPSWCQGIKPIHVEFPDTENRTVEVPLCYTGEHVFSTNNDDPLPDGLGLTIDFRKIMPANYQPPDTAAPGTGATPAPETPVPYWRKEHHELSAQEVNEHQANEAVKELKKTAESRQRTFSGQDHHIKSSSATGALLIQQPGRPDFSRIVNLETWQVKTVVMGHSVTKKYGKDLDPEVYPMAIQYEGRRPTMRGTIVVSLAPYADVTTITKRAADFTITGFMGLVGTMCGMAFMVNSLMPWITKIFLRFFPGPAELARREEARAAQAAESQKMVDELEQQLVPKNPELAPQEMSTTSPLTSTTAAAPVQNSSSSEDQGSGGGSSRHSNEGAAERGGDL